MSITRSTIRLALFIVAVTFAAGVAVAQTAHILVPADKVQWGPAPPILPAGAQIAVLEGNPAEKGADRDAPEVAGELQHPGALAQHDGAPDGTVRVVPRRHG